MSDLSTDRKIAKRLNDRFVRAVAEEGASDFVMVCVCLGLVAATLGEMPEGERSAKLLIVKDMFRDILGTLEKLSAGGVQ